MLEFLKSKEILFCFIIFVAETATVCISNLKTMLLVKGSKTKSTMLAFCEILLWATIVAGILNDLQRNIFWLLAYCAGYTAGYYFGAVIERRLALGTIDVQFIIPIEYSGKVEEFLRENNYGYYISDCRGKNGHQNKYDTVIPRKKAREIRHRIEEMCEGNVFTTNYEVSFVRGGYSTKRIGK